jgi:hypothetical protein
MQTPGSPRIATPEAQIGGKLAGWAKILDGCSANRTSSSMPRKNARVDSPAGAAAKLEVGGAPAQPDRIVDPAHLLLPRRQAVEMARRRSVAHLWHPDRR